MVYSSAISVHNLPSVASHSPKCVQIQTPTLNHTQFLSSNPVSRIKKQFLLPNIQIRTRKPRSAGAVFAAQSNLLKVVQTVWKVGKDGIEAGTNLVPDSVPRPIARISVTIVAFTVALFVVKSFLSTAFFVLGMMGLIYFVFISINKDEGPGGGGGTSSTEDSLEEARRIMEKYK